MVTSGPRLSILLSSYHIISSSLSIGIFTLSPSQYYLTLSALSLAWFRFLPSGQARFVQTTKRRTPRRVLTGY
ncbi:hypothetical protein BDV30DRAFT_138913 [Aspergillus minisclerotigenes]|uniref:Uncharacterized protein n=1 Tax=Aspergillus minisclerotigenes TaxID=656917 RepID=A0A5N6J0V5_9EURO|nr:hypothetical protein BDV30DRAFT_138913 [Aspergillus minisclerotigenes]